MTLREEVEKRLTSLKSARECYEPEWKEISRFCQPARGRFLEGDGRRRMNRSIYNSHGILAFRTLAGGMTSGLSSPSRPWFRLTTHDEAMMDDHDARTYLAEVERRIYAFLASTNFYGALKAGYSELGLFGTEACFMEEHWREGAVCRSMTAGEYWIATGDDDKPDSLYRRVPTTVRQAVERFKGKVSRRVQDAYDRSDYLQPVQVRHAIQPNSHLDTTRKDWRGKAFVSLYWDEQDGADKTDTAFLEMTGSEEQPFWAPRWEVIGGNAYGVSPAAESLPDLRELNLHTKRKNQAVAKLVRPEMIVPAQVTVTGEAGNVVSASSIDREQVIVPYQVPYQLIGAIAQDVQACMQQIDRLAYADLFLAITNMQGVQPRNVEEIASRNEEKMTQLGPVIERVNQEKLAVAIDRTFGIMNRKGMLPTAPDTLQGHDLKIEFVSILTQMQRMIGIGQTERVVGFIGQLAASFPEAADRLDVDATIDDYADRAGSPVQIIRPVKDAEKIRADRAQQQHMQQMAAAMPAVKDGADAARLMSEAQKNADPTMVTAA